MRILVIDDDLLMLELLDLYLPADQNYVLDCHATAESALEALKTAQFRYDCILLDIMLPDIDGIECCRLLREIKRYQTTPILMMTASRELGLMQRAFESGATDFLFKPLNVVELRARVKSAGMLNQSIAKAQHSLQELGRLTKIRFDEMLSVNLDGAYDLEALERHMLRYEPGCYTMSLISLEIPAMRDIYDVTTPLHFRECIRQCAKAMIAVMKLDSKITYIGKGRFVGVSHGRDRINLPDLSDRFNQRLSARWDREVTDVLDAPTGSFDLASEQRIWSGLSIANKLCELGSRSDKEAEPSPHVEQVSHEEDNIFAQLNW
ncbi:response regulator [Sulfitobacter sp.]|uniref:response regulator n=1 Tax=Sulfitobacter sp. TaxID=1903071 RepID=UPI003001264D